MKQISTYKVLASNVKRTPHINSHSLMEEVRTPMMHICVIGW